MTLMKLDKDLYRQAHEWFQQWNQAEQIERLRHGSERPPGEGWKQYLSLWQFYQEMMLQPSHKQQEQKLAALEIYYTRVTQLESWRRSRGRGD